MTAAEITDQPPPVPNTPSQELAAARAGWQQQIDLVAELRRYIGALEREAERVNALARILTDLDRCPHGRHRIDSCLSCPGGRSAGNPHMPPGWIIGYDRSGEPYVMPSGDRPDPLCSTSEPAAWRPR